MGLIDNALEQIRSRLNAHFEVADPRADKWVILSNPTERDGHPFANAENKIVMCLFNIEHDTIISTYNRNAPTATGGYSIVAPPIYINLYVLFLSNFSNDNYQQGLAAISKTISFFQENPYFNHNNLPGLAAPIDKIAMELTNLDLAQVNYLMAMLGTKYVPSVCYKIRMLPFAGDATHGTTSAISDTK